MRPKEAPKKKLSRNFEWKGEKETNAQRSARLTLEWDRRRRGETQDQTAEIMKERLERESKRMGEVNRMNEEHEREEKERAERKLRKMEARERGEPVSEEEEFEFGTATNDVLVLHPQPHEFFDGFGGAAAVDVRVVDAQREFQKSDEQKRVILTGPLGVRGSWEQNPLPQREEKNKGKGKGRKEREEERKEEEEGDVSDKATSYEESETESREARGRDEEREESLAGEEQSEEWEIVEKYARETGMDVDSRANLIVMASQLILNSSGAREEEGRGEGEEERESEERTTRRKKDRARDESSKARSRRDPSVEKRSKSRSSVRQVKKKSTGREEEEEEEDNMEH